MKKKRSPIWFIILGKQTELWQVWVFAAFLASSACQAAEGGGLTPLHKAVISQNLEEATSLLAQGAEVNALDDAGETPLHWAAAQGDLALARLLLSRHSSVAMQDKLGRTPLAWAQRVGSLPIAELLVKAGADVNWQDREGTPLIQLAMMARQPDLARFLASHGADARGKDRTGKSAFSLALERKDIPLASLLFPAASQHLDSGYFWDKLILLYLNDAPAGLAMAKALVQQGLDPNARNENDEYLIDLAASAEDRRELNLLLACGAKTSVPNSDRPHPLQTVLQRRNAELVRLLLEYGAGSATDSRGYTALHFLPEPTIALMLLEHGAQLEARNRDGATPLYKAVEAGQDALARTLLTEGANADARDRQQRTPLMAASIYGSAEIIARLLAKSVKIDAIDNEGRTALHYAATQRHASAVEALLKAGANANLRGGWMKQTPLIEAIQGEDLAIASLLLVHGADINLGDTNRWTSLHYATRDLSFATIRFLLSRKAATSLQTKGDYTAFDLAACRDDPDVLTFLLGVDASYKKKTSLNHALYCAAEAGAIKTATRLISLGADVNMPTEGGSTPLLTSISNRRDPALITLLLDKGAGIGARDDDGNTALHRAIQKNQLELARILIQRGAARDIENREGKTALDLARSESASDLIDLLQAAAPAK